MELDITNSYSMSTLGPDNISGVSNISFFIFKIINLIYIILYSNI